MSEMFSKCGLQPSACIKPQVLVIVITLNAEQNEQHHASEHHSSEHERYQTLFSSHGKYHDHELHIYLRSFTTSTCIE
jgi:hypothetical protein